MSLIPFFQNDNVALVLSLAAGIFFVFVVIETIFFKISFNKSISKNIKNNNTHLPPVSIVLYVHDNYSAIKQYIPLLLSQEYPDFEVVIVNNSSEVTRAEHINIWARQNDKITVVQINETNNIFNSSVYALSIGIKAAKHDIIIVTSINCRPKTIYWLRSMVAGMQKGYGNVLGISNYTKEKTFLSRLKEYEKGIYNVNLCSFMEMTGNYVPDTDNFMFRKHDIIDQRDIQRYFKIHNGETGIFNNIINKYDSCVISGSYANMTNETIMSFKQWLQEVSMRYSKFRFLDDNTKIIKMMKVVLEMLFFATSLSLLFYSGFYFPVTMIILMSVMMLLALKFIFRIKSLKTLGITNGFVGNLMLALVVFLLSPCIFISSLIKKH